MNSYISLILDANLVLVIFLVNLFICLFCVFFPENVVTKYLENNVPFLFAISHVTLNSVVCVVCTCLIS